MQSIIIGHAAPSAIYGYIQTAPFSKKNIFVIHVQHVQSDN